MLRTIALLLVLTLLPSAAAAPAALDADGDAVPDEIESQVCGRALLGDLIVGIVLHPWAGGCTSSTDYEAVSTNDLEDTDGDGLADLVEEALCHYEDRNDPIDGTCAAGDYTSPV